MRLFALSLLTLIRCANAQVSPEVAAKNAIQQNYDRLLKGLPSIEIVRVKRDSDPISEATRGVITADELTVRIESTLKRFRLPILPLSRTPTNSYQLRENVGNLVLDVKSTASINNNSRTYTSFELRLTLNEPAVLKRDPSILVGTMLWESTQTIDAPFLDAQEFLRAVESLAQEFALSYLSANQPKR